MTWIPLSQCYSQTDSAYCLPIGKARLLLADALRLRVQVLLNDTLSVRVSLLENQVETQYTSFTKLLKIEADKLQIQKEITLHTESISGTYKDQNDTLKKQARKLKWQRAGLAVITLVVVGLSL